MKILRLIVDPRLEEHFLSLIHQWGRQFFSDLVISKPDMFDKDLWISFKVHEHVKANWEFSFPSKVSGACLFLYNDDTKFRMNITTGCEGKNMVIQRVTVRSATNADVDLTLDVCQF